MRKVIAAINVTLDGYCDHTSTVADDEMHEHYNDLLRDADTMIWGRITYQLMESYWPNVVNNPTGEKSMDEFAVIADNISKIVFSRTLQHVEWRNSTLAQRDIVDEITALREEPGKAILIGSPSLILSALKHNLVDELQLCVQPIIADKGLLLLKDIGHRIDLKFLKSKVFRSSGAIVLYYEPRIRS